VLADVLTYWLGDAPTSAAESKRRSKLWYGSTQKADTEIQEKFGALLKQAEDGELDSKLNTLKNRIAMVILLDQLSRNIYRGKPTAFQNDARCLEIAKQTVEEKLHLQLSYIERVFLYHPYEHSESRQDQQNGVALFEQLLAEVPSAWRVQIQSFTNHAYAHFDIIKTYGRFPHRNVTLGRTSTPAETEFLNKDVRRFGQ
jgi:uncharacterized protein (DUF924 family)